MSAALHAKCPPDAGTLTRLWHGCTAGCFLLADSDSATAAAAAVFMPMVYDSCQNTEQPNPKSLACSYEAAGSALSTVAGLTRVAADYLTFGVQPSQLAPALNWFSNDFACIDPAETKDWNCSKVNCHTWTNAFGCTTAGSGSPNFHVSLRPVYLSLSLSLSRRQRPSSARRMAPSSAACDGAIRTCCACIVHAGYPEPWIWTHQDDPVRCPGDWCVCRFQAGVRCGLRPLLLQLWRGDSACDDEEPPPSVDRGPKKHQAQVRLSHRYACLMYTAVYM